MGGEERGPSTKPVGMSMLGCPEKRESEERRLKEANEMVTG